MRSPKAPEPQQAHQRRVLDSDPRIVENLRNHPEWGDDPQDLLPVSQWQEGDWFIPINRYQYFFQHILIDPVNSTIIRGDGHTKDIAITAFRELFKELDIPFTASQEEVLRLYRKFIIETHPDGTQDEEEKIRRTAIRTKNWEAWRLMTDPLLREREARANGPFWRKYKEYQCYEASMDSLKSMEARKHLPTRSREERILTRRDYDPSTTLARLCDVLGDPLITNLSERLRSQANSVTVVEVTDEPIPQALTSISGPILPAPAPAPAPAPTMIEGRKQVKWTDSKVVLKIVPLLVFSALVFAVTKFKVPESTEPQIVEPTQPEVQKPTQPNNNNSTEEEVKEPAEEVKEPVVSEATVKETSVQVEETFDPKSVHDFESRRDLERDKSFEQLYDFRNALKQSNPGIDAEFKESNSFEAGVSITFAFKDNDRPSSPSYIFKVSSEPRPSDVEKFAKANKIDTQTAREYLAHKEINRKIRAELESKKSDIVNHFRPSTSTARVLPRETQTPPESVAAAEPTEQTTTEQTTTEQTTTEQTTTEQTPRELPRYKTDGWHLSELPACLAPDAWITAWDSKGAVAVLMVECEDGKQVKNCTFTKVGEQTPKLVSKFDGAGKINPYGLSTSTYDAICESKSPTGNNIFELLIRK